MQRVIVCAAVRCKQPEMVVCGVRHGDLTMFDDNDIKQYVDLFDEEGFVDNRGVFLSRTEAWKVADNAGQIKRRVGGDTIDGGTLFSENLY